MNACVFVLPAKAGKKASFSVTVFLALAVFLTIVTLTLPQNSDNVSYLGIYLVIMAVFSTTTRYEHRPYPIVADQTAKGCGKTQNGVLISDSEYTDMKNEMTVEVIESKVPPPHEEDTKKKNSPDDQASFAFVTFFAKAHQTAVRNGNSQRYKKEHLFAHTQGHLRWSFGPVKKNKIESTTTK
ncbi:hypothetical protein CHS0354_041209 [Potamilus streckersoni]|uniref:Neurotransmitter-gated ion-channel transmembrane domain-containing protein n=1 Tax=Potamilus streckersoni TaxID=2493646 RepID=A0AAE0SEU8_9BIVA|nr:hypothetical protein CHS0354_041209 [Potamilus streckersoni]